ncbi:MAG: thioredoxin family protein [Planctomycetes bacterium]|nr:thioredoxin family protein [Planctomycetota bacterium]
MQFAVALALVLVAAPLGTQEPAPNPAQKKEEKQEKPPPLYDEQADAKSDIAAALAKAKKENRRVLIQWGGNWCGWCKLLDKTLKSDKQLARKILYEYDVVHVDVGHFDKNMELAKGYGADLASGVPFLTVLDADGKVIVNQETGELESKEPGKHEHDVPKVLAFLEKHQAPYLDAEKVYADALVRAKAEGKRVFLHFGAPWCVWCHRLEDWMAKKEIAALLAKEFVDVKIDEDRMKGATELEARVRPPAGPDGKGGGIPWFAFLDADGKPLADCTLPDGNITGFPVEPAEIARFVEMLEAVRVKLTPDDVAALRRSLEEEAARLKARR